MSTHKTTVDKDMVLTFLKDTFSKDVSDFEVISGGEGSQAYSFNDKGEQYIIRVNKHHTLGFRKDEYASLNYSSPLIPIPKILKIGRINDDLRFCISQRVEGKILDLFSAAELNSLLPNMFEVLDAIHATDVSNTKGCGKWDADGQGEDKTWKEYLLCVDKYSKGEDGKPGLFETSFLEKDFWDKAYARMKELLEYCGDERFLVHGDYGFNNVLSDGKKITGVIDWECSVYGDFLFDVAWLSFWSQTLDYQDLYLKHSKERGVEIKNFNERMLCYKINVGLSACSFYAYSGQEEKYKKAKETILKLI